MENLMRNVDYIFDNREAFNKKYAEVIAKFEAMGIDHTTAEAMAITLAATCKTITE